MTGQRQECKYINQTRFGIFGAVVHHGRPRVYDLAVVLKATYAIAPGQELTLIDPQPQFRGDEWSGGGDYGPGVEFLHGAELGMPKPGADLLLRGSAYAPGGKPCEHCEVTFSVGDWRKSVLVSGDRAWKPGILLSKAGDPQPFRVMPLTWSRAYGGAGHAGNPVGRGHKDGLLPNLEYADDRMTRKGQKVRSAGFGPVNRFWPQRSGFQGTYDKRYIDELWPAWADDFDARYFHDAPSDQQLRRALRGDEQVGFRNLHPACPEWGVRLPGLRIRCFIEDSDAAGAVRVREVPMHLDTLFADTDAGQLELLWRGCVEVRSEDRAEVTRMLFAEELLTEAPKDLAFFATQLAEGKDQFELMEAEVMGQADPIIDKTQGVLDRYGLDTDVRKEMAETELGFPMALLACFPFDPTGPLPPDAAHLDPQFADAAARLEAALEKGRSQVEELGYDWDKLTAGGDDEVAPLEQMHKSLIDGKEMLVEHDQEVPQQLEDALKRFEENPKDPFGLSDMLTEMKGAGMDLAQAGPEIVALEASGDFSAFLAAIAPNFAENGKAKGSGAAKHINEKLKEQPVQPPPEPDEMPEGSAQPGAAEGAGGASAPSAGSEGVATADTRAAAGGAAGPLADGSGTAAGGAYDATVSPAPPASPAASTTPVQSGSAADGPVAPGAAFADSDVASAGAGGAAGLTGFQTFMGLMRKLKGEGSGTYDREQVLARLAAGQGFKGENCCNGDFRDIDLAGHDFTGCLLIRADFRGANLDGAVFSSACVRDANFAGASLRSAVFEESDCGGADFSAADLRQAQIESMGFVQSRFVDADLRQIQAASAAFDGADLRRTDLRGSVIKDSVISKTDLTGAKGAGADWDFCMISECTIEDADFRGAKLVNCAVNECRCRGMNLANCELTGFRVINGSDFNEAVFSESRASESTWINSSFLRADFSRCDLRQACFMDNRADEAVFTDSDFRQAMLRRCSLIKARFDRANLCQASLGCADLRTASLREANCFEADFIEALTTDADLTLANVKATVLA